MKELENFKIVQENIEPIMNRLQEIGAENSIAVLSVLAENVPILAKELEQVIKETEKDTGANINVHLFDYTRMLRMADTVALDVLEICSKTGLVFK
ncbi:hypothetical protein KGR20_21085 [Cytobacillus oceanisediminis]|uniref:perilipin family protein n=1 Tax=Cytobacillus oceanisediminis TaxID=665099 RepID=UPI001CCBC5FC|nr:perilipin family protein [Cytobacillus oceanisediminis]MBZ9536661.1 hypothetical protein [Cytobacillus oceanisediminis]